MSKLSKDYNNIKITSTMLKLSKDFLTIYIITFLCGMSVMILELAGVRILSPFLGSTHVIYICIIGVIMASLSAGYFLGGKISNKNPSFFKLSLFFLSCACYIFFLALLQFDFLRYILNFNFPFVLKTLITSLFLFSIPSILLGMVSPYITQLALNILPVDKKSNKEGNVIGKIYAISTIGSITGTFLCGFYLIIYFGIDTIFFALAFELFICAFLCIIIYSSKKKIKKLLYLIYCSFLIVSFFALYYFGKNKIVVFPNSIYSKTTPYNYINIIEFKTYNQQTIIGLSNNFSFKYKDLSPTKYTDDCFNLSENKNIKQNNLLFAKGMGDCFRMFHSFFIIKQEKQHNLLLGNAVGIFLSGAIQYCTDFGINNISFDVVEIDKDFSDIGKNFFNMPVDDKRINFFYEDARTFLNRDTDKKYDTVFFDIYVSGSTIIPYYLITKEAFEKIRNKMKDSAIFIMNVIGETKKVSKRNIYLRQIYTQIKTVFEDTRVYKVTLEEYDYGNYLIVAYKNPNDTNTKQIQEKFKEFQVKNIVKTNEIFTDKYSPIEKFS